MLHQIPLGIFNKKIKNIIGNGVVIDLMVLFKVTQLIQLTMKVQKSYNFILVI